MTSQNQRGQDSAQTVRLAEFRIIGPGDAGDPVPVHFNPESLEYTVTNNIKEQGNSTENKQQVSKSSGKLSLELVFDTTLDGSDVRAETERFQAMMKPREDGGKKIAPVVEFAWGTYRFKGIFTSYKETLDFFSSSGVPLRASISLTMTQQDGLFDPSARGDAADVDDSPGFSPPGDESSGPDQRGPATGDPATDRGLAEDNGEENPRFFSGNELSLPSGPDLQPPAAFATGGLSIGASLGGSLELGIGVDVGFSLGVSAGVGIGLGIEAGIDVGASVGFDFDIGIDVGIEAQLSVSPGGSAAASGAASSTSSGSSASSASSPSSTGPGSGPSSGDLTPAGIEIGGDPLDSGGGLTPATAASSPGMSNGAFQRAAAMSGGASMRSPATAVYVDEGVLEELPAGPSFGAHAAAGVPAALGAFAGLRPVGPRRRKPLSLATLRAQRPERELRTDSAASFDFGGRARDRAANGLGADVGARAEFGDRPSFDGDSGEDY